MSLLGAHVPVVGWCCVEIDALPAEDRRADRALLTVAADLAHRGKVSAARAVRDAREHFAARLLEGRHEEAEVRIALGLPLTAALGEVLAALAVADVFAAYRQAVCGALGIEPACCIEDVVEAIQAARSGASGSAT